MLKRVAALAFALALVPAAKAADTPRFDTETYCKQVADSVGGSYQIELTCRQQEQISLDAVRSADVPDRIMGYCGDVAGSIGGSYQILKTCIEQELKARSQLQ